MFEWKTDYVFQNLFFKIKNIFGNKFEIIIKNNFYNGYYSIIF